MFGNRVVYYMTVTIVLIIAIIVSLIIITRSFQTFVYSFLPPPYTSAQLRLLGNCGWGDLLDTTKRKMGVFAMIIMIWLFYDKVYIYDAR